MSKMKRYASGFSRSSTFPAPRFFESDASFRGYQAINQRVTEVLRTLPPNAFFRTAGAATQNHNLARLPWTLGFPDGAVLASGMDIVTLERKRITGLYIFIDPPTGKA
jgi:hypothetical protein